MTIQIDPEFRALIPPLTADERQHLEANLKADGCRDPLVVWNGLLLDGHHRFEICTQAHLPYQTVEQSCADREEAKIWIIHHQFGRRNLNMAQRAELAMQLEPLLAAQAKARQLAGTTLGSIDPKGSEITGRAPKTVEQLAEIAGISGPSMTRAAAVFKRGTPALKEQMRSGKVKVSAAYDRLKAGEAIAPPPRPAPKAYTHKPTIRKESELLARLQELLQGLRDRRHANNEDMKTRKWIPHGINVRRQANILDWIDTALEEVVGQLHTLVPRAPARAPTSQHETRTGATNGQKAKRSAH